jgi:hypothetical protein
MHSSSPSSTTEGPSQCPKCNSYSVYLHLGDNRCTVCGHSVSSPEEVDVINAPPHYRKHPSGVECITIVQWFNYNRGNAIKYIWRAGEKGDELEDLRKAAKYLEFEIALVEGLRAGKFDLGQLDPTPENRRPGH